MESLSLTLSSTAFTLFGSTESFEKGIGRSMTLKRIVDWLEKISAGSMLIGIFQDRPSAVIFGLVIFVLALKLERRMK